MEQGGDERRVVVLAVAGWESQRKVLEVVGESLARDGCDAVVVLRLEDVH